MKKYFGVIYKATNKINNKIYIGQTTVGLKIRKSAHENTHTGYYFDKAIKKYGKNNFRWGIIECYDSKEEMDEMEFHYIKQYDSFGKNGYNLTYGGEGSVGWSPSITTRQKISASKKGKCTDSENPFYGKKHSDEARKKMRGCRISCSGKNHHMYGKTLSLETRIKIGLASKGRNVGRKHTRAAIEKIRKAHLGKKKGPFSLETRKRMSKARLGKKLSQSTRKKLSENISCPWLLIFPNGSRKIIRNLYKYSKENGLTPGAMSSVATGKRCHHKGYRCIKLYDMEIRRM